MSRESSAPPGPLVRTLFVAARDDLYGASRAALSVAERLGEYAFAPYLAVPAAGPLAEAWKAFGPVQVAPVGQGRSLGARLTRSLRLRPLLTWAQAEGIELVVAITLSAMPAARRLGAGLRVPVVLHLRNTYEGSGRRPPFEKYGASEANLIVAVSGAVLSQYQARISHAQRQRTIADGIGPFVPKAPAEARRILGLPPEGVWAGVLGAVSPVKGTALAVDIAEEAQLSLAILGDGRGAYVDALRARIGPRWLGFVPAAATLLPALNVLLHPSRGEAFGLAPLEAMAAGVPVIASNVGGLPEALGDGAVLLPPHDRAAWLAAVRRVLEDEPFRASLIARGRAQAARMTAAVAAERTAAAYRELLG